MPDLLRRALAGAALVSSIALAACGEGDTKPDPAAIDQHLNNIIRDDEANKARLIEEARDREDVRKREMEQRQANYSAEGNAAEAGNAANAANATD